MLFFGIVLFSFSIINLIQVVCFKIFDKKSTLPSFLDKKLVPSIHFFIRSSQYFLNYQLECHKKTFSRLPPQFIAISNHESMGDIPLVYYLLKNQLNPQLKLRFVVKDSLLKGIPYISFILRNQSHFAISRKKNQIHSFHRLHQFVHTMKKENTSLVIFPEGTRYQKGKQPKKRNFKYGFLLKLLRLYRLPLVVLSITGDMFIFSFHKNWISLGPYPKNIHIQIIDIIDTDTLTDEELHPCLSHAFRLIEESLDNN